MKVTTYLKLALVITIISPFLGACAGTYAKLGLEPKGIGENDLIVLEMSGNVSLTYTDKDGKESSKALTEDPLNFSVVNVKPNNVGKPMTSFTVLFVRPLEDSFAKPGIKLHQGIDHCTRDESGDPIVDLGDTGNFNSGIQPHLKIGSEDIELKVLPLTISGTVEGLRINREDGSSTYYDKTQLLSEITYQNPGSIGDCKLTKNVIIGSSVNSPVAFQLVNKNVKAVTADGGSGVSAGSGALNDKGPQDTKSASASGGCSMLESGGPLRLSGSALFWAAALLLGIWQWKPHR